MTKRQVAKNREGEDHLWLLGELHNVSIILEKNLK